MGVGAVASRFETVVGYVSEIGARFWPLSQGEAAILRTWREHDGDVHPDGRGGTRAGVRGTTDRAPSDTDGPYAAR